MQINIKTSEQNQKIVQSLTKKLGEGIAENVIARIALAFSLQTDKKFEVENFQNYYDSKGKEYKDQILFDSQNRDYYIALICQHYSIHKTDENIPKYVKLHIDHGLEQLGKIFANADFTMFDFLSKYIEKGCKYLENTETLTGAVVNSNQQFQKDFCKELIQIEIGKATSGEPIFLHLNDSTKYNNCHIAIAGNSGTGKTQFALDFINQIYQKSNGEINYIYLDFKGLQPEDVKNYNSFFSETHTEFIDVPHVPFPINPLSFIDNVNEQNREMGIDKFVDIVCKYSQLGVKQQSFLRDATKEAFLEQKSGSYPTLQLINEKLNEIYDKKDTLTDIVDSLSRYKFFDEQRINESFLNKNLYLSLSGSLPKPVRFTSLFLIINYIYNVFMNMPDTPTENNTKALRYVIMIDEAHVLFKEKKYQEILEKMLREVRSKGVSIVLLSQGIEEYNQSSFDFSSLCEIAFLLDIKDKNNTKAMEKFLGYNNSTVIAKSMSNIQRGQAISNIKEYDKAKLFTISQFWKR